MFERFSARMGSQLSVGALALILGLCAAPPSIAQQPEAQAPGDFWAAQTEGWKLGYVYGWSDGESSAISRECERSFTTSSDGAHKQADRKFSAALRECRSAGAAPSPAQFQSCVKSKQTSIDAQLDREREELVLQAASCLKEKRSSLGVPADYTMGQFISGIDHFYADYRNRLIPVYMIAEEVEKQLNGATDAQIESDLELDRKSAQSASASDGGHE
jgi:hypothetical protein